MSSKPVQMRVRAPGKIVLWGEYAVLAGAPAVVMAVDRYADVSLTASTSGWRFHASGFQTPGMHRVNSSFSSAPVAAIAESILRHWGYTELPMGFALHTNSSGFYRGSKKFGLGSSAAVTVATLCALAKFLDKPATLADALAVHRQWQGGKGSGLDIATSWLGGLVCFENGVGSAHEHSAALPVQVIWTGLSTSTAAQLDVFSAWRSRADSGPLDKLCEKTRLLTDTSPQLADLQHYVKALQELDRAAGLNIFTHEHQRLATIAARHGLVYKPCGAGGGDIGIAFGEDRSNLAAFAMAAAAQNFVPLNTEIAKHGVELSG